MQGHSFTNIHINGTTLNKDQLNQRIEQKVTQIYTILKTSFGPLGLDKILVNSLGDVTITNDGATILKNLNIDDPFQKLMVNLSTQVDTEVGDGTTTTVLFSALLIKHALELKNSYNLHSSTIINGYKMAYKCVMNFIRSINLEADVQSVIKTCLSSKIVSCESEYFSKLLADSSSKSISFLKIYGESMRDSEVLNGFGLNCTIDNEMVQNVNNAKIMLIDFDLQKARMPLNVLVTLKDVEKIEGIKKMEEKIALDRIEKIVKSGVNVVLSTRGIDDLCTKKLIQNNIMGVKRVKREDLQEISKLLGVSIIRTMSDLEGSDSVESIGTSENVSVKAYDDKKLILISTKKHSTFILKGASEQILDEMERSLHDAVCVIKRIKQSKNVLPGGGAMETASYLYLKEFLSSISSKEYIAINKFSEALLDLVRIIISNAGLSDDLLSELLRLQHEKYKDKNFYEYGIDAVAGKVQNNVKEGIVEPAAIKLKAFRVAVEAAITIIRIDEMITVNDEKMEKMDDCH